MRVLYIRHSAVGVALLPIHLYFASVLKVQSKQMNVRETNQCVSKQMNVYRQVFQQMLVHRACVS